MNINNDLSKSFEMQKKYIIAEEIHYVVTSSKPLYHLLAAKT